MKQALLIGCGNKRGENIVNGCIDAGYSVTNIGSSMSKIPTVSNIKIEWKTLDLIALHKITKTLKQNIDFIFFNQNASSLSQDDFAESKKTLDAWTLVKGWSHSYWLSCQLPYVLIKTLEKNLNSNTKIGWMLSSFINPDISGVDAHPDYSGNKFTNYQIMKSFAKKYNCFGINPDFNKNNNMQQLIKDICMDNKNGNGGMLTID
jgi:hypothetical protein